MGVCLVLGAGASLANAKFFHPKRYERDNPPLDANFFTKVIDRKMAVPRELAVYAETSSFPGCFGTGASGTPMEEFFRDIFLDFPDGTPSTKRAYAQLVRLYGQLMRDTTEWMAKQRRTGPVGDLIQAASSTSACVDILTFNHDLVIENEITKKARLSSCWCLPNGYGSIAKDLKVTRPGPTVAAFAVHGEECLHERRIQVLKLHGSLNWYVALSDDLPTPGVLTGARRPQLKVTSRRSIASMRAHKGETAWPMLVPPIHSKETLIRSRFKKVWDDARIAVASCTRLVFFGYSLPQLDLAALRLFQSSLADAINLDHVDVINPDPAMASRYAAVLRDRPIRWYPSIQMFLHADDFINDGPDG